MHGWGVRQGRPSWYELRPATADMFPPRPTLWSHVARTGLRPKAFTRATTAGIRFLATRRALPEVVDGLLRDSWWLRPGACKVTWRAPAAKVGPHYHPGGTISSITGCAPRQMVSRLPPRNPRAPLDCAPLYGTIALLIPSNLAPSNGPVAGSLWPPVRSHEPAW